MTAIRKEKLDVLIIGAGISGIGMAYTLLKDLPNDKFAVIESRDNIGGTWDFFKYPGLRSDSDMYTFAYSFKAWTHREYIGSSDRIMGYLNEVVDENHIKEKIRFQTRIMSAEWCSDKNTWTCLAKINNGETYLIETDFILSCTGYYNYEAGYKPTFEGEADFKGDIIHPQKWPEGYDYSDKDVVVIGSGATAFTIVPTMAKKTKSITMLQRSPGYVYNRPASDGLFRSLSKYFSVNVTNSIMRCKYLCLQQFSYGLSKIAPKLSRKLLINGVAKAAGNQFDVNKHFSPTYKPWDQRVCMVPDNDMFEAVKAGKAKIKTEEIDRFTESGVKLKNGETLNADLIVTATGLDLQFWGGMTLKVDGYPVQANQLTNYKGMMFSQMPNMVMIFGYTNTSWTVKAELTYDYISRLLTYMKKHNHKSVFPYLAHGSESQGLVNLTSGYVQRAASRLPKQGNNFPWCNKDFYFADIFAIKHSKLADGILQFDDKSGLKEFHHYANEKVNKLEETIKMEKVA